MANTIRIYETDDDLICTVLRYIEKGIYTDRRSIITDDEDLDSTDEILVEGLYHISDLRQLGIGPVYYYNVVFNSYELSRLRTLRTLVLDSIQILGGGLDLSVLKSLRLGTVYLNRIAIRKSLTSLANCSIDNLEIQYCTFDISTVYPSIDAAISVLILRNNGLSMTNIPVIRSIVELKIIGENIHSIGTDIEYNSRLKVLHIEQCGLSDCIPDSILRLSKLQRLVLNKNQLDGSIPSTIKRLSRLQDIDLSMNRLEGSIPILPPYVENIRLHYNRLSGPTDTVFVPTVEYATLHNNLDLCGTISSDRFCLTVYVDKDSIRPDDRDSWISTVCIDDYGYEYISYIFLGM